VAAVPAGLVSATVAAAGALAGGSIVPTAAAAVALSQGVWKPMLLIKLKCLAAAVLAVAAVGSGAALLTHPAATATPAPPARAEPTVEQLKQENERLRREVARLKERLAAAEAARRDDGAPTDAEVLRAMPRVPRGIPYTYETFRDDIVIVKNRLVDKIDPPRYFPLVGVARLWHRHWECTVYFTETTESQVPVPVRVTKKRVQVIYIDRDTLVPEPGEAK
jgi:hypothetical protein